MSPDAYSSYSKVGTAAELHKVICTVIVRQIYM